MLGLMPFKHNIPLPSKPVYTLGEVEDYIMFLFIKLQNPEYNLRHLPEGKIKHFQIQIYKEEVCILAKTGEFPIIFFLNGTSSACLVQHNFSYDLQNSMSNYIII